MANGHRTDGATLRCRIVAEIAGGVGTFRGRVVAGTSGLGRYAFRVAATGPGGTSNIAQGGEFELEPDVEIDVGQVGVNVDGDRRLDVSMTVTLGDETTTCRLNHPR